MTLWGPVENPEPSRVMSFKSEVEQGMALRREREGDRQTNKKLNIKNWVPPRFELRSLA